MKTTAILASLFCLSIIRPLAGADPLDRLVDETRRSEPTTAPEDRQQVIQKGLAAGSGALRTALANDYLTQVKASIIDPENHGGWPCRSWLIYEPALRRQLTPTLTARFDKKPDPTLAYALICPALFHQNEALLSRVLEYLRKNDRFLHDLAQTNLKQHWRPFIANVLKRQTPATKQSKADPLLELRGVK